jgi:hypothetical protein
MIARLLAILLIYAGTSVAWFILGGTLLVRSETQDGKLRGAVGKLWGTEHRQEAPQAWYETKQCALRSLPIAILDRSTWSRGNVARIVPTSSGSRT